MLEYEGFRILEQLIIPGFTGAIGGLALVVMASLNDDEGFLSVKNIYMVYIKFALLGVIAGIAAVNLLNPQGDISQVLVLGLIAGLSGVSYLKRTALVDDIQEKLVFDVIKRNAEAKAESAGFADLTQEDADSLFTDDLDEMDEDEEFHAYINDQMDEWTKENPNATDGEYDVKLFSLLDAVSENPDLVKLHKRND